MVIDLQLVKRYVSLQVGLLAELSREAAGVSPLSGANGVLVHEGEAWSWGAHGLGFAFVRQDDGLLVDAHDCGSDPYGLSPYTSDPDMFDAWRLRHFAESASGVDVDLDEVLDALRHLKEAGDVVELSDSNRPRGSRRFRLKAAGAYHGIGADDRPKAGDHGSRSKPLGG